MGRTKRVRVRPADTGPSLPDPADAKLTINSYEDVANSEDEFALAHEHLLLAETPQEKLKRKHAAEEFQHSEDELLPYSSESASDDDSDSPAVPEPAKKKRRKDDSSDGESPAEQGSEDEELGGWGTKKREYYNADPIETEQDALDEEKEALRLQRKKLEAMDDADYMPDAVDWLNADSFSSSDDSDSAAKKRKVKTAKLPAVQITAETPADEKLKILRSRYPEFEPLASDFMRLQPLLQELKLSADAALTVRHTLCEKLKKSKIVDALRTYPLAAVIREHALLTYVGTLAMYFALLSSPIEEPLRDGIHLALDPAKLRAHPIMDSLVAMRSAWLQAEALPISDSELLLTTLESFAATLPDKIPKKPKATAVNGAAAKPPRRSRAEKRATAIQAAAEKTRAETLTAKLVAVDAEMADLAKPSALKRQIKRQADDFAEQPPARPNGATGKTLRFYTSQIAQARGRRERAGRGAGGDDDVPYKERVVERRERLNREAERRGKEVVDVLGQEGDGEADADVQGEKGARPDSDEEYYHTVAATSTAKAKRKAEMAETIKRQDAYNPSDGTPAVEMGPDGKRKISYQMQKNKGLAPKRKKEVRNPRVKKKLRYADKLKKLGSTKQVFKGGEFEKYGRAGYGGEMSGISRGLVRSVKL